MLRSECVCMGTTSTPDWRKRLDSEQVTRRLHDLPRYNRATSRVSWVGFGHKTSPAVCHCMQAMGRGMGTRPINPCFQKLLKSKPHL